MTALAHRLDPEPNSELLAKKGLGPSEMLQVGTALISGDLAFRQHEGGHTDAPNWPAFLQFASRYLSGNWRSRARVSLLVLLYKPADSTTCCG